MDDEKISAGYFRQKFPENPDVVFNEITIKNSSLRVTVASIDGMVSSQLIDDYVLKPLFQERALGEAKDARELVSLMMLGAVYHCQRKV
ncbi:MAG: spore germination protein, partial [Oscillospiraceae bacterium]|nr:spore germination protein [Oscillospiraceae bacterium]